MSSFTYTTDADRLTLYFTGKIDSVTSQNIQTELDELLHGAEVKGVTVDLENVKYVASSGLRILLQLRKTYPDFRIVNVPSDIYEVFEMTGFTEIMEISKAYKRVSVEDCRVIGQGANGIIYQLTPEIIIKANKKPDALAEIIHERELARRAFVLGVPTAISYNVVRIGDNYGAAYELLNASTIAQILQKDPEQLDECVRMSTDLMKIIHSTVVAPEDMPDMRAMALSWLEFLRQYVPQPLHQALKMLFEAVPEDLHMIHGDYHIKNVMIQNNEALLIDMDTLAHGCPVFELAFSYNAYRGFSEIDPEESARFLSIPREIARAFWRKQLCAYLGTEDDERVDDVERKARLVGYVKLLRYVIRKVGLNTEKGKKEAEFLIENLTELVKRVDTLMIF